MQALICSVGTEILLGNIVDTNSQYIASHLKEMGIDVYKMVTVGDNFDRLYKVLSEANGLYDYIFLTGGLGPTADDITKEVVVKVCGKENELVVDPDSMKALEEYFEKKDRAIKINKKQAIFPKSATILKNPKGTAPGCIIESKSKFILLPGPPHEMTYMFDNELQLVKDSIIKTVTAKTALLGEWDMASRVDLTGSNPTISPYATDYGCILRITAKAETEKDADKLLEEGKKKVKEALAKYLITFEDKRKEEILIDLLRKKNETLASAESITGGLIASSIIDIPGASDVIHESYITYSNETKNKLLNVSYETIEKYDVVSRQVLKEMLDGLYEKSKANLCIATTGYAHLGHVFVGILYNGKYLLKEFQFNGDRNRVRLRAKNRAIDLSIIFIRGDYEENLDF
ncbi:CinA family nicotinamide mononucleotide deamidase-related protein [Anaerococcus tetradius]|uniref:Putative competence-damage inducible protein n=1 Tax=Anaerococcus tetradius ATCC 35098 TaxID=525255 RepID=C2CJM0_9FIRM|nr:CinA family nicotinamide mononucleotide deamidase-related protein [Anaerococcus tetradius]EEI82167.1 competence/damage-inducible domain protein CinA [Anaerococcus tetradius ATCC 35098]